MSSILFHTLDLLQSMKSVSYYFPKRHLFIPRHRAMTIAMHISVCAPASTYGSFLLVCASSFSCEDGHSSELFRSMASARKRNAHAAMVAATISFPRAKSVRAAPSAASERLVYSPTLRAVV